MTTTTTKSGRRPWVHRGVRLGFVRGPVYWIDRTVGGERYQVSTGKRTAEAAFGEYQRFESDPAAYAQPQEVPEGGTWGALCVPYLTWAKNIKNTSPNHRECVAKRLADWGAFSDAFTSPDTFTRDDVEKFVGALREGLITSRERKNHVSGGTEKVASKPGQPTVNRYLAALKGFMRWCRENGHTKNFADREVKMAKENRDVRPPESIEKKRWLAVGKQLDERWLRAQEVLLGSGMRYSELARMREEHFRPGGIVIPTRKGGVGFPVPVSKATLTSARRLLELGGVPDDEASEMNHRLRAAAKAVDLKRYTPHHLRHTFGTTCLRNGTDLETLRLWMGHASITTTQKYLHALRAEQGMPDGVAPF